MIPDDLQREARELAFSLFPEPPEEIESFEERHIRNRRKRDAEALIVAFAQRIQQEGAKDRERILGLLRCAKCPNCDGSGSIPVPLGEQFVSREMAIDAGDPSMEGSSMGIEWGQQQCQWCDERNSLFGARPDERKEP